MIVRNETQNKELIMKLNEFLNICAIANNPAEYADSIILVYTDNCQVLGPYFGESAQFAAYDKATASGRQFTFNAWAHKG